MIINIWAKLHLLRDYFITKERVTTIFPGGITVGKPVVQPTSWMYCYFDLDGNNMSIRNDVDGTIVKEGLFEFIISANKKNTPDVDVYEALDSFSNAVQTTKNTPSIDLDGFKVYSITEDIQSGILRDTECPYLIARYRIVYKYFY